MKIKIPISSLSELKKLKDINIDEIYCGVLTEKWLRAYSSMASINRVERASGSLKSYNELKDIIEYAHKTGIKVFLTLNALYTSAQHDLLNEEMDSILKTDIDGIIVADLGLLNILRRSNINKEIHVSTGLTIFNSQSVSFFKNLGVSRITLPRALRLYEIRKILHDNPNVSFDVFIMNGGCSNIDGFCTFQHGLSDLRSSRCSSFLMRSKLGFLMQNLLLKMPAAVRKKIMNSIGSSLSSAACSINYSSTCKNGPARLPWPDYADNIFACGGCFVNDFLLMGVSSVKIVGRSLAFHKRLKDILFIRELIDKARSENLSDENFREYSKKLFKKIYSLSCGKNCYYDNQAK